MRGGTLRGGGREVYGTARAAGVPQCRVYYDTAAAACRADAGECGIARAIREPVT